jgi:hypothetical protein
MSEELSEGADEINTSSTQVEQLVVYPDLYYQVRYSWDNSENFAGLNFIAHHIQSLIQDERGIEVVDELDEDKVLEGHVKFDGCMNVEMGKGYAHFCGRFQTRQYGQLFERIYDKAKEVGCDDN